ncbi:hypothetical protein [Streptomyces sp. NPDC002962]|uniref:hypothetical protein n=1 Tax=Streptomyces sp. NPDC002962 TaxID=3364674 RepID=UPI0036B33478
MGEPPCAAEEGIDLMIRVLAALVATADIVGFVLSIGVAADVIMQHPYDWIQTGSTQKFRIFLIFAPPLAILLGPVYLAAGIFYLQKVRPRLAYNARMAASQSWPTTPRKPTLGLNWTWHELRTPQKIKAILSAGGAFFLDTLIVQAPQTQDGPPQWLVYAAPIFLWPAFFFAIYLVLGAAQIFLKLKTAGDSSPSPRIQDLAQAEYNRRLENFYRNHSPQAPWYQQPW